MELGRQLLQELCGEKISKMQNIKLCNSIVTIKSRMKEEDLKALNKLVKELQKAK